MIPLRSPTASCYKSSSPWRTTQPSLTARVRTKARSIAPLSFTPSDEQKRVAEAYIQQLEESFKHKIVTHVGPLTGFYPAEQYHQNYLAPIPTSPTSSIM